MARHLVIPVIHEDRPIRPVLRTQPAIPRIRRDHEIRLLLRPHPRALARQLLAAQLVHVDVVEEKRVAPFLRPLPAEIDHRPAVRALLILEIRDRLDVLIRELVPMLPRLPLVARALDALPHVRDHARLEKRLPPVIPIHAPLVARALRVQLEFFLHRMPPPHAAIELHPLAVRRTGPAHIRLGKNALRPVQPAVRAPGEIVQRLVRVAVAPAVEHLLRLSGESIRVILAREKKQVRRRTHPYPAMPHGDTRGKGQLVKKHRPLPRLARRVEVLENQNPVLRLAGAGRVVRVFHHPQPPAIIHRVSHRLHHLRLRRHHLHAEPRRQLHLLRRLGGGQRLGSGHGAILVLQRAGGEGGRCESEEKEEGFVHGGRCYETGSEPELLETV